MVASGRRSAEARDQSIRAPRSAKVHLNDDDIAAITRIWAKLENAQGPT